MIHHNPTVHQKRWLGRRWRACCRPVTPRCFAGGSSLLATSAASAVPIYGGPTYDSTIGHGYGFPNLPVAPGATAGGGTAVGHAGKFESGSNKGNRAVRWDASGSAAVELGHLGTAADGITHSFAFAVNSAGTAVGDARKFELGSSKGSRAVRWDASGTAATELGHLGTDASGTTTTRAYAVSAAGTAVGYAQKYESGSDKGNRAVRWDASGTAAVELGHIGTNAGGYTNCYAHAVNAAGTAVGYASKYEPGIPGDGTRAVRWNASGTAATELGHIGTDNGQTSSAAYSVNTAGTAVGYAFKFESGVYQGFRAVRWSASSPAATELDHLGTAPSGFTISNAHAVDSSGMAVGYAAKYESGEYKGDLAVRWDASGTAATELGNLGTDLYGVTHSVAWAVNGAGTAVGEAHSFDLAGTFLGYRAVAWGLDGVALDLNTVLDPGSGWLNLFTARGISDTGWITGIGTFDPDGTGTQPAYDRMFLMQVPEPAGVLLLALGLTLLGRWRRTARRGHQPRGEAPAIGRAMVARGSRRRSG